MDAVAFIRRAGNDLVDKNDLIVPFPNAYIQIIDPLQP